MLPQLSEEMTHPLTIKQYISRVLVPEIATLLIMQDRGYEGPNFDGSVTDVQAWRNSYRSAETIRRASHDFGQWRSPESDGKAQKIWAAVLRSWADKKERVEARRSRWGPLRRRPRARPEHQSPVIVVSDDEPDGNDSDAENQTPDEWDIDDFNFDDEAVKSLENAEAAHHVGALKPISPRNKAPKRTKTKTPQPESLEECLFDFDPDQLLEATLRAERNAAARPHDETCRRVLQPD